MRTRLIQILESGRRENLYEKVIAVDVSKLNEYAFESDYLQADTEVDLNEGDVIIEKRPVGSVKNGFYEAHIYRVKNDKLEEVGSYHWSKEFLSFRDKVAELLNESTKQI